MFKLSHRSKDSLKMVGAVAEPPGASAPGPPDGAMAMSALHRWQFPSAMVEASNAIVGVILTIESQYVSVFFTLQVHHRSF